MPSCYRCQREIVSKDRIGRRDTCPGCEVDLHCCRNCAFYDTGYAHACRESQAEPVTDKEAGNFCDYFALRIAPAQPTATATDARARLEALFKQKA